MDYAFQHEDKVFTPEGRAHSLENTLDLTGKADVDTHNRELEAKEIEWLRTAPEKLFLYVANCRPRKGEDCVSDIPTDNRYWITTWLGTSVSNSCILGRKVNGGFGFHTYKRSVDCRIFGVHYVGWYMESSGNYCRLRKAKKQ